jgi:hypothetical protein
MASFKEIRRNYCSEFHALAATHRREKAEFKLALDKEWREFLTKRREKKQEFQESYVKKRATLYRKRLDLEDKLRQQRAAVREARQREAAAKRQIEAQVEALKAAAAAAGLKLTINLALLGPDGQSVVERPKLPLTSWQQQLQRVGKLLAANHVSLAKPEDHHPFTGISQFCSFLKYMTYYARYYVPGMVNLDSDESIVKLAKAFPVIPASLSTQQQAQWCHEVTSAPVADGVIVVPPA